MQSTQAHLSAYLHVVEDSRFLKVELDIYAGLSEGFPAPTKVIIPRPHPQLLSLYKVVSSQDAIAKLTQASKLHTAHTHTHTVPFL